ncbi:hypothetical protein OS493_040641, partial [Desmophyllum pertusum]
CMCKHPVRAKCKQPSSANGEQTGKCKQPIQYAFADPFILQDGINSAVFDATDLFRHEHAIFRL